LGQPGHDHPAKGAQRGADHESYRDVFSHHGAQFGLAPRR
jgi:hypothetical protein